MRIPFVLVAVMALVMAGCGDKNPTAPSPFNSGTWTGTLSDPLNGTGALTITFTSSVGGSWTLRFPNEPELRGTFAGTARNDVANLLFTPTPPLACGGQGSAQLAGTMSLNLSVTPNRLSGRSTFISCQGVADGTVELTR